MRGQYGLRYAFVALLIAAALAYASRDDGDRYSGMPACGLGETQLEYGCACAPGFGGSPCKPCTPGFYSPGGTPYDPRPECLPCGPHFSTPKAATAASQCSCEPGFGAQLMPLEPPPQPEKKENWAYAQAQQQQQQPAHSRRLMEAAAATDPLYDPSRTAATPAADPSRAAATAVPTPVAAKASADSKDQRADSAAPAKAAAEAEPEAMQAAHTTGGVGDDSPMTPRARVIKFKKGADPADKEDKQHGPAKKQPGATKTPPTGEEEHEPYKREEPSHGRSKEPIHPPRWSSKERPAGDRPDAEKPSGDDEPDTVGSRKKYGNEQDDEPKTVGSHKKYGYVPEDTGPKTVGSHDRFGYKPEDHHKHGEEPEQHQERPSEHEHKKHYGHDDEEQYKQDKKQYSKGKEQYKQDKPSKQYEEEEEPPKKQYKQDKPSKQYEEEEEPPKKQYKQDKPSKHYEEEEEPPKKQYKQDKPSKHYEEEEEPPKKQYKQDKPSKHYVGDDADDKPPKHYVEERKKQPSLKEKQDKEQYGLDKEQYGQVPKHYIEEPREPRHNDKPSKRWVKEPDVKHLIEEQERKRQHEEEAADEEIKTISSYDKYNYKPAKDDPDNYQQIPADDWVERQQQQAVKDSAQQQQQEPGVSPDQAQPEHYQYRGDEYTDADFQPYRHQAREHLQARDMHEESQQQRPQDKPEKEARSEPVIKAPEVRGDRPRDIAPEVRTPRDTIRKDHYDPLADLRDLRKDSKQQPRQETPAVTPPEDEPAHEGRYDPLADMKYHGPGSKHADEHPREYRHDPLADMRYHAEESYDGDYVRGHYERPAHSDEEPQTVGSYKKYHIMPPVDESHHHHVNPELPRKPREEYEPQDAEELYGLNSGGVVINRPEHPREEYERYQQQQQREEYERQQQQREQYERQQQQRPEVRAPEQQQQYSPEARREQQQWQLQNSPKPRQQPIKEYLPSPAQQPTHDTDSWWEQQRDQAVRKRGPQAGSGRDAAKPTEPVLEDKPQQYNQQQRPAPPQQQRPLPVPEQNPQQQYNQQYEQKYNQQYNPQYNPQYNQQYQQDPRYQQKPVPVPEPAENTIVEKFGRKWDTKVCAPCPRGLYALGAPGYTPALISSSSTAATATSNTTAAVAGSTAGSPAGSTVSVAALSPETKAAAAATTQAATAEQDAATASYSYNSYYSSPTSRPRAQLCERCMGLDKTPGGFITPREGASSPSMCGCAAGHGGSNCKPCNEGFYSEGGRGVECVSCPNGGHGFTTVPRIGARDVDDCVCLPGHGFNGEGCELCPQGTWSRGFSRAPCKPCKPGLMSPAGSSTPESCVPYDWECPLGQWAPASAVSPEECRCYPGYGGVHIPGVPCHICQPGTYSEGNDRGPCSACPRGKTSDPGAWSDAACYAPSKCPSGAATFHDYRALVEAAKSKDNVQATAGVSIASVGGGANANANVNATTEKTKVMKQRVYRTTPPEGHDVKTAKSGGVMGSKVKIDPQVFAWKPLKQAPKQATIPAAPVMAVDIPRAEKKSESYYYEDSSSESDDYYAYKSYIDTDTCVCKPGYGTNRGAGPCHQCPTGTWSAGGANTPCQPCPEGYISDPGADAEQACFESRVECAPGQYAPESALSSRDCVCKPGHGGKGNHWSQCTTCPAGTFSSGGSLEPCIICPSQMASPEGSIDVSYCHPHNICPVGTWVPDSFSFYSGDDDKVLPGLAAVASVQAKTSQFMDLGGPSPSGGNKPQQQQQKQQQQQQQANQADNSGMLDIGFIGGFGGPIKPTPAVAKKNPTPQKPAAAAVPTRGAVPNNGGSSSRRSSRDSPTPHGPGSRGDGRNRGHDNGRNGNRDSGRGDYDRRSSSDNARPYYPQKSFEGWWDSGSMFAPTGRNYSRSYSGPRRCNKGQWDLFDPTGATGYGEDCQEDYYEGYDDHGDNYDKSDKGDSYNEGDNYDSLMDGDFVDWALGGKKTPQPRRNNGYDRYGYDKDGYDMEGYDRDGYNKEGRDPYGFDRRGSFKAPRSGDDKRSRQDKLADEWYGDDGSDIYDSERDSSERKYYDHDAVDYPAKRKRDQTRSEKQKHYDDLEKYGEQRNDEWYYDLVPPVHASVKDCKCKPGYGLWVDKSGSSCKMCEPGRYSPGNTLEPCQDCPPGYTSSWTSTHAKHCVPLFKECGPGGYVPQASKGKAEECKCYPGYGLQMGEEDESPVCDLCPPGTYSEGHSRSGCSVCPEDKTSHPGSWKKDQCHTMSHFGAGDYQSLFATPHSHSSNSLATTSAKGGKTRKALARAWAMRMKPHSALAQAIQAAATSDMSAGSAPAKNTQQASAQQATPQQQQQGANAPAAKPAVTAGSNTTASSS